LRFFRLISRLFLFLEVEDMFPADGFLGTADNTSWPKNEGIFTNISQNLSVQVKLESDSSENEPFVDGMF